MDPDANLREVLDMAHKLAYEKNTCDPDAAILRAERLACLLLDLDEWIVKGGFLPGRWRTDE